MGVQGFSEVRCAVGGPPPPCNSGIVGIQEYPNLVIIPYSYFFRVLVFTEGLSGSEEIFSHFI